MQQEIGKGKAKVNVREQMEIQDNIVNKEYEENLLKENHKENLRSMTDLLPHIKFYKVKISLSNWAIVPPLGQSALANQLTIWD